MKTLIVPIVAGMMLSLSMGSAAATTLDEVKARGFVQCGVNSGLVGFASQDGNGNWQGFDVDFCRAIAAAIFNDPNAARFSPLNANDRFAAVQKGEVDILVRNTTWTMSREVLLGLAFSFVNYYDGQGFMVRRSAGLSSALDLTEASVCVVRGTTTETHLASYFSLNKMKFASMPFETNEEAVAAYDAGDCTAYTTDASPPRRSATASGQHEQSPPGSISRGRHSKVIHRASLYVSECGTARRRFSRVANRKSGSDNE